MIKNEIAKMLVEQINKELHSGYLYMESCCKKDEHKDYKQSNHHGASPIQK